MTGEDRVGRRNGLGSQNHSRTFTRYTYEEASEILTGRKRPSAIHVTYSEASEEEWCLLGCYVVWLL
jgi:hypothetical protein